MGNAWHSLLPVRHPYPGRERSETGKPNPVGMKKNVPWHIRASRAVACDMFLLRASAHPRGAFYMLLFTHTCPVTEFAVASHLNTANSCCHHVFLRHFRFQKCLPVNSNYISSNLIQNTLSLWVRQRFFPSIKSFHFALHISYNILHIFYNDTVIRFSQIFLNHRILCETHLTNYQNKKIN